MSSIALSPNAAGTGTFSIASPNSNTNRTLTLPDETGTVLSSGSTFGATGPAFSAIMVSQSIPYAVTTKVTASTEDYDYGSRYNNTGATVNGIPAYSFMPNIAGVYLVAVNAQYTGTAFNGFFVTSVYKNNVFEQELNVSSANATYNHNNGSAQVFLNGSTDYLSVFVFQAQGAAQPVTTRWSSSLVRQV